MKITIVTKYCTVVDELEVGEYNLDKPIARQVLLQDLLEIIEAGRFIEDAEIIEYEQEK